MANTKPQPAACYLSIAQDWTRAWLWPKETKCVIYCNLTFWCLHFLNKIKSLSLEASIFLSHWHLGKTANMQIRQTVPLRHLNRINPAAFNITAWMSVAISYTVYCTALPAYMNHVVVVKTLQVKFLKQPHPGIQDSTPPPIPEFFSALYCWLCGVTRCRIWLSGSVSSKSNPGSDK